MATTKPRITISLEPEQYQTLKRFSDYMSLPMSKVVTEAVVELLPALDSLASVVGMAKKLDQQAREQYRLSMGARLTPEEIELDRARDDALQAYTQRFDAISRLLMEASEGPGGRGHRASGDGARQDQPPSL